MLEKILVTLNIRRDEAWLVGMLVLHSACMGVAALFAGTPANALFIQHYGAENLPYIYIGLAILISALGYAYSALSRRISFRLLLIGNLGLLLGILVLLRLTLSLTSLGLPIILLRLWADVIWVLTSLEFWGLASRLLDVRQSKRLFGLIGAGDIAAKILGGFAMGGVVQVFGTENLLWIASAGLGGSLIALILISARHPQLNATPAPTVVSKKPKSKRLAIPRLQLSQYAVYLFGLSALSYLALYFVDNAFFAEAQQRYVNADDLTIFIGNFFALANVVSLVSRLFISAPLINRFGVLIGLLSLPSLLVVGAFLVAGAGSFGDSMALVFWLITLSKLTDTSIRYSVYRSATLILYQPLNPNERLRMQTSVESIVEPIASGVAGLLLLVLITQLGFSSVELFYGVLWILAAWIGFAFLLNREYTQAMVNAIAKRQLQTDDLVYSDAASIAILKRGLESSRPTRAIYALTLLAETGYSGLGDTLITLLDHPFPQMRREALVQIEKHNLSESIPAIRRKLDEEKDPATRAIALRTLLTLASDKDLDDAERYIEDPNPAMRHAALVGLMRSGGIEGIFLAGQSLFTLVNSPNEADRVLAAQIIGDTEMRGLARQLKILLNDPSLTVWKTALEAAGKLHAPKLWEHVALALSEPQLASTAASSLVMGGESVIPILEQTWENYADAPVVLNRIARVLGSIGGDTATQFLSAKLKTASEQTRTSILTALSQCDYRISPDIYLQKWIEQELNDATWTLYVLALLGSMTAAENLRRALGYELHENRQRLFLLLSFAYDRSTLLRVRETLSNPNVSGEKRAYAFEILDMVLPRDFSKPLLVLLDNTLPPSKQLMALEDYYPQEHKSLPQCLFEILDSKRAVEPWTVACAIKLVGELHLNSSVERLQQLLRSPSPLFRETAHLALGKLSTNHTSKILAPNAVRGGSLLTLIERVLVLKSLEIFSQTPEPALVAVAGILEEIRLNADEQLFAKGEMGNSMYIIYRGEMRIHDGKKTIDYRKQGEVVGELTLLDSEPRSASVSAQTISFLLRLDQTPFYDLMGESPAVAKGVIMMLNRYLRQSSEKLVKYDGTRSYDTTAY